jgi:hypothetical protein
VEAWIALDDVQNDSSGDALRRLFFLLLFNNFLFFLHNFGRRRPNNHKRPRFDGRPRDLAPDGRRNDGFLGGVVGDKLGRRSVLFLLWDSDGTGMELIKFELWQQSKELEIHLDLFSIVVKCFSI